MKFRKFIPVNKVEEQSDGSLFVYGLVTAEKPDLDNEICDYEATKPHYKAKTEHFLKATLNIAGMEASIMPMREMHQLSAIGSGRSIDFDDAAKTISMGFKVVDTEAIKKFKAGVYIGFSQGGDYVKTWRDQAAPKFTRFEADPGEVSAVDSPCLPDALVEYMKAATFTMVSKNGSIAMAKFKLEKGDDAKTKRKGGKDLHAGDFAYVGDPEDTSTWKLPIHDAAHVRNALARFNQTEGIPTGDKGKVKSKIDAAAKKFGVTVSDTAEKLAKAIDYLQNEKKLAKGLWSVQDFAGVLQTLNWLAMDSKYEREVEDDASTMPEDLAQLLEDAISCFCSMVEEETGELAAKAKELAAKAAKGATLMKVKLLKGADLEKAELVELRKSYAEMAAEYEEFEKAAKGMMGHLTSMHKAVGDHCSAMVKAHGDHMAAMHGEIAKCMKASGAEQATGGPSKDEGEAEKARKAAELAKQAPAVALTEEQINDRIAKGVEKAMAEAAAGNVRGIVLVPRNGAENYFTKAAAAEQAELVPSW